MSVDLTNTEEVDFEVVAENSQGGPAGGLEGAYTPSVTDAFTWHPAVGGGNLKGTLKGNPQFAGSAGVDGTLDFAGTLNGEPVNYSNQINVTPSNGVTTRQIIGTPREQS